MRKLLFAMTAPLLLAQGKRVRARTVRLPEPPGARQGKLSGEQKPLSILLLGDSAIAGVGSNEQSEAVTGQLIQQLSQERSVEWQLVAKSSLTCAQVLEFLKATDVTVPTPDVVLISVGVNDVTKRTSVPKWRADLDRLTGYLTQQLGAKKIIYTALPPMHKFPALPQPLRWFVGQQAHELNKHLAQHCEIGANTQFLEFDVPYAPEFIAKDGYHPSPKAAGIWARAAADLIIM